MEISCCRETHYERTIWLVQLILEWGCIRHLVLYPLEVSSKDDVSQRVTYNTSDESTQHLKDTQASSNNIISSGTRPRRDAAAKALQKISKWTTILGPGGCRKLTVTLIRM